MFAYEQEVRILHLVEQGAPDIPVGFGVPWEPEQHVKSIFVHPEADQSFMDTVTTTVETYAPALKHKVVWSAMNEKPPF
jgi:hypothetical protein